MARAVELARNSLYLSDPNPRVGCVIARDGNIIAEGWTQQAGGDHAEIHALKGASGAARGADVFVSLEPCSHSGRTGPCTEALIRAGVRRVFAAMVDPNPKVAGAGIARLREAGIEVHVGLCEHDARTINLGFVRRMRGGAPWVRLKLAATIDGRTATRTGRSKWITSEDSRADVQSWRARSSAIVTGIGTIVADDPSMNVRLESAGFQPLRVILDSSARMDPSARILRQPGPTLVVSTRPIHQDVGESLVLPAENGRVSLPALLGALAERQCNEVLVEAGATLSGAFAKAKLVDEYVFYLAPRLLGDAGRSMFDLGLVDDLEQALRLEFTDVKTVGADLRIIARPVS